MTQPSGWCTDWGDYDLFRLWQMVSGEDDEQGWAQVQSWFRMRGAVEAQRQRLFACRQALEEQWPPENSPAAAVFIAFLDRLIASMTETATSAESTARGLGGIMHALASAKAKIKPLYDGWRTASTDLTPRWWDATEDELTARARSVMAVTELEVADYSLMIEIPPKYDLGNEFQPLVPIKPPRLTGSTEGIGPEIETDWAASGPIPPIPHDPPTPLPRADRLLPATGPILSGVPTSVMAPPGGTSGLLGASSIGVPAAPGAPPPLIARRLPRNGPVSQHSRVAGDDRASGPGRMPIAPATPPAHPQAGRPTTGTTGGRSPTVGISPMGSGVGAKGTTVPVATRRVGARTSGDTIHCVPNGSLVTTIDPSERADQARDPNHPWIGEEGVAPVITPPHERPHDPGFGIIGIDR